jgi:hypothetical protein
MHGNVEKGLDDNLPFQAVVGFIFVDLLGGGSQDNQHLFILDGHGPHITI